MSWIGTIWKAFKDDLPRVQADKEHAAGVIHFQPGDLQALAAPHSPNAQAYMKIMQALNVNPNAMNGSNEEGEPAFNIYPETAEQARQMDALLDEAENAVKDPEDSIYTKFINELRGISGWSNKKHHNFSYLIILGSWITLMGMSYIFYRNYRPYSIARDDYRCAKAWSLDPDAEDLDMKSIGRSMDYKFRSVTAYREETIEYHRKKYEEDKEVVDKYTKQMETGSSRKARNTAKDLVQLYTTSMNEHKAVLDELETLDLKGTQKYAIKQTKKKMRKLARPYHIVMAIFFFIILLLPAYIYTNNAWGYNITRYRQEDKFLQEIQKLALKFAIAMFGVAAAMKLTPDKEIIRKYSDGSVEREQEMDAGNVQTMGMQAVLIIIGIVVLGVVSTLIMLYSTIMGYKRNIKAVEA